jgi:ADP-heptose:LPS heptosyltransferase
MKLPSDIKKIIIFRALQLGDMLCIIPAVKALKNAYPHAQITLACMPWAKSFTERFNHYFDEFLWFPGYPGLPEQPIDAAEFSWFLEHVQRLHYDLALQMQGNGSIVNPMIELFGASYTAGFYKPDDYKPNDDYFMEYPDYGSEIERHIKLMEFLGIQSQGTDLEFPLTESDLAEYEALQLNLKPKGYVCIHPGSRGAWRQWPTQHFARIADYCISCGLEAVITGTKDEAGIAAEVIAQMQHQPINVAGKTSLGAMGVLINNAYALVSNCTGVSHMAAAFKTPSIVISMDGEPERWGPINKQIHYTVNWLEEPDFEQILNKTTDLIAAAK